MSHRVAGRLALGVPLGLAAAGYWTSMSPYSQLWGRFPFRADGGDRARTKTVALTFDDGPNEPFTSQIADFLDHHAIKATFFQVGRCVERHPVVSRRLSETGHVIGNHSYAHRFDRCWSEAAVVQEVGRCQSVLRDTIGREPGLYRPPWLVRTPSTLRVLQQAGLHPVSGEFCHPLEPWQPSPERIARRALATIGPGSIVVFHDGYDAKGADRTSTVAAVRIVVDTLLRDGYAFSTVDDLLGTPAYL
jgi:peptidoglycan-N-acetylglucosamine deacetylase